MNRSLVKHISFLTSQVVNYDFLSIHLYTSSSNKNRHWKVSKKKRVAFFITRHIRGVLLLNTDRKNELQIYILSCGEAERFSVSNLEKTYSPTGTIYWWYSVAFFITSYKTHKLRGVKNRKLSFLRRLKKWIVNLYPAMQNSKPR